MLRADDIVVYDSLSGNAIPTREEKSVMRRWFESSVLSGRIKPGAHVKGGLSAFRKGTEALGAGAVLAAIHVETDGGLDKFGMPVDGIGGAMALAGSAIWPDAEVSSDARDLGADALTVWSFRKTTDWLVERRIANGRAIPRHLSPVNRLSKEEQSTVAGEDPIVNAAKNL